MKGTISIFGAGAWGTTLALILARTSSLSVTLWSPFEHDVATILRHRQNKTFLPDVALPETLTATTDISIALAAERIIFAVPVEYMRKTLRAVRASGVSIAGKVLVSAAKGIEVKSLTTPSAIIQEELYVPARNVVVLSGPNIAKEIAAGIPAVAAAASSSRASALTIQQIFEGTPLRVYTNADAPGVEIAAALKNILAIACGISDGLGFGANTKSALVCRGLKEMIRFGRLYKAREDTFWGAAGLGDVCTTCFSPSSRNLTVGRRIGQGEQLSAILSGMKTVAEGVTTVKAVYTLSRRQHIDMPITQQVYDVLYRRKKPQLAVKELMSRPLKAE